MILRKRMQWLAALALAALIVGTTVDARVWSAETKGTALARISTDVEYLASDELEGRGPGTAGLEKAAEYIQKEFARLGLTSGVEDGSYFQPFELSLGERVVADKTHLNLKGAGDQAVQLKLDESFRPFFTGRGLKVEAPIVFVGYGISAPDAGYDDFQGIDVEGKIVLLIRREPQQDQDDSPFDGRKVSSHSYLVTKLKAAAERKAAGVLMVNDPFTVASEGKDELMPPQGPGLRGVRIPFAQLTIEAADKLLAASPLTVGDQKLTTINDVEAHIDEHLKPVSQPLDWTVDLAFEYEREMTKVVNVVGVLEGEGPLANETMIIGAHYDHLGYGGYGSRRPGERAIHNGADDNASGTAALMEIARRFTTREQKPARRIVFIAFSGEERGLLGSAHYVANPLFPLADTVTMLNFDMIGNLRGDELVVHGSASGEGWESLITDAAKETSLSVTTSEGVIAASDHFSFYRSKIPVMFLFTGLTDIYHTPDDDTNTLNLEGLEKVVDYADKLSWLLANHNERPKYRDVKVASPRQAGGGMAYLGVTPDYAASTTGVSVTNVKPGSPAEAGGLQAGDIIIRLGEVTVADLDGLAEGLRKYKAGQSVEIVVKRADEEITSKVTLGEPGSN